MKRREIIVLAVMVVCGVALRLPALGTPTVGFRQSQTVITTYWFLHEGISPIRYQTPIFGPPWRVPFEFPTFQITSAVLATLGVGDVHSASRLAAMLYFLASALLLFLLARTYFVRRAVPLAALAVYLLLPYGLKYSTEPLIDHAAVAMALAYFLCARLWLTGRGRPWLWWSLAVTAGILGYLTKPTTMPIVIVALAIEILMRIVREWQRFRTDPERRPYMHAFRRYGSLAVLIAILVLVPVLAAHRWTVHADEVKHASLFTRDYTSSALQVWTVGTRAERLVTENWVTLLSPIRAALFPQALAVFAALGLILSLVLDEGADLVVSMLGGAALTLLIFFNLYRHDYYPISLIPVAALLSGAGIALTFEFLWRHRLRSGARWTLLLAASALAIVAGLGANDVRRWRIALRDGVEANALSESWYRRFNALVPADAPVVSVQNGWASSWLLYFERKGFIYENPTWNWTMRDFCRMVVRSRFAAVIAPAGDARLGAILQCWPSRILAGPHVPQNRNQQVWLVSNSVPAAANALASWSNAPPWTAPVSLEREKSYRLRLRYRTTDPAVAAVSVSNGAAPPLLHEVLPSSREWSDASVLLHFDEGLAAPVIDVKNTAQSGRVELAALELRPTGLLTGPAGRGPEIRTR